MIGKSSWGDWFWERLFSYQEDKGIKKKTTINVGKWSRQENASESTCDWLTLWLDGFWAKNFEIFCRNSALEVCLPRKKSEIALLKLRLIYKMQWEWAKVCNDELLLIFVIHKLLCQVGFHHFLYFSNVKKELKMINFRWPLFVSLLCCEQWVKIVSIVSSLNNQLNAIATIDEPKWVSRERMKKEKENLGDKFKVALSHPWTKSFSSLKISWEESDGGFEFPTGVKYTLSSLSSFFFE